MEEGTGLVFPYPTRENLVAMAVGFTWTLAGILAIWAVVR
jgi:hypothetical protein